MGDPFESESPWKFYVSHFLGSSGLYIYHLSVWLNFNLLHSYQWVTFSIQSCLLLYSFHASLLYLLNYHYYYLQAEYNYCYTFIGSLLEHLQEIGPKIVVTNPEGSKETDNNDQEEGASEGRRSSRRTSDSSSFFTALDMDTSFNIGNLTQFHSALSPLHLSPCSSPMTRNAVLSATDTCSLYDLESSQTFLKVPWPPRENVNGRPHMFEANNNCIQESVTLPFRNKARNLTKAACNSRASRFIQIPSSSVHRKEEDIQDVEIRGWEMQEVMNGICGKPTTREFLAGARKQFNHRQIHATRHNFMNGHCNLEVQHRQRHGQIEWNFKPRNFFGNIYLLKTKVCGLGNDQCLLILCCPQTTSWQVKIGSSSRILFCWNRSMPTKPDQFDLFIHFDGKQRSLRGWCAYANLSSELVPDSREVFHF